MAEAGQRVFEEALAVGPAVGDPARHGGQEGGVGRAPEPGNATHGRRSLQGSLRGERLPGRWRRFARWPPSRAGSASPCRSPACRCTSTASGTRRSPRSASPTCGRVRPTATTASRRSRSRRRGTPTPAERDRDRARVHPRPRAARADGGVDGRRRARPLRARHRRVVARDRRTLERDPVRARLPTHARHAALPPRRARRREGDRALRHLRGPGLPARRRARGSRRPSSWPPCAPACCAWRARRATAPSSTGSRPPTSRRSRRTSAARRSSPASSSHRRTTSTLVRAMADADDHELPDRRRLRRVPRVAGPRSRAPADVGRVGGR